MTLWALAAAAAAAFAHGALTLAECSSPHFFVVPGGDDFGRGTIEAPFGTIERAQLAARAAGGGTVELLSGRHELRRPIYLDTADTGLRLTSGSDASVSGGSVVGEWKEGKDRVWSAPTPRDVGDVRQLYVDGGRAARTRVRWASAARAWEQAPDGFLVRGDDSALSWPNPRGVELLFKARGEFTMQRCTVEAVLPAVSAVGTKSLASLGRRACNVTGSWQWSPTLTSPPRADWRPFEWTEDANGRFRFTSPNDTPFKTARGTLYANGSLDLFYACPETACNVTGSIDASCNRITTVLDGQLHDVYTRVGSIVPPARASVLVQVKQPCFNNTAMQAHPSAGRTTVEIWALENLYNNSHAEVFADSPPGTVRHPLFAASHQLDD